MCQIFQREDANATIPPARDPPAQVGATVAVAAAEKGHAGMAALAGPDGSRIDNHDLTLEIRVLRRERPEGAVVCRRDETKLTDGRERFCGLPDTAHVNEDDRHLNLTRLLPRRRAVLQHPRVYPIALCGTKRVGRTNVIVKREFYFLFYGRFRHI